MYFLQQPLIMSFRNGAKKGSAASNTPFFFSGRIPVTFGQRVASCPVAYLDSNYWIPNSSLVLGVIP